MKQFDNPVGSPAVPCDIAPSASEIFFTELNAAYALASASQAIDGKPQRVALTVSSGGRTYVSKPVATANLALGRHNHRADAVCPTDAHPAPSRSLVDGAHSRPPDRRCDTGIGAFASRAARKFPPREKNFMTTPGESPPPGGSYISWRGLPHLAVY